MVMTEEENDLIKDLNLRIKKLERENRRLRSEGDMLKNLNEQVSKTQVFFHRDNQRQLCYNNQLMKTSPYILVMVNDALETVMASDVYFRMSGVSRDAVKEGMSLENAFLGILNEDTLRDFIKRCRDVLDSQGSESYLLTTFANDKERFYQVDICYYLAQNEDAKGLSIIFSDMTEIVEAKKRAENADKAKSSFLANMSHEIRTPINAILGMNEMILRENRDPVIAEYADSVQNSGKMLLMLVNDVLDYSKIEAGKMEIHDAGFTMSQLLHDMMPMLQERAGEKSLVLRTTIANEVPDGMISDEFRIRQVLINLLNNAIKYTDEGSVELILGGEYMGDDDYLLKMNVKDTGRGIREEAQKHLFEAFSRADLKENRSIEGTGLGLAIVKSILDSMNAEITVKSRYGEGSEFIVQLPVRVVDRTPLDEDYEKKVKTVMSERDESGYIAPDAAVLAVDDNASNLRIVSLFLKHVRIVPELCKSGTKAIELCKEKHYDLLLLDHRMPDPDGIRTLELIRNDADSLNRETPAVVLTANAIAGSDKIYSDAGFVDYLTKPLDSALLERTVKRYLPEEKILSVLEDDESEVFVFKAVQDEKEHENTSSDLRTKLEQIPGLDYETALRLAGGYEELLRETVGIIASECDEKIGQMCDCISSEDWKGYELITHSIKGLMASLGLKEVSERAKKHEYAAIEQDDVFIRSDSDAFIEAYREVCARLSQT